MSNFMENLKNQINTKESVTENGAVGYATSGKALVDINFETSSLRALSDDIVEDKFSKVYYSNMLLAVKWLFFASDVRGGMGERRLFRVCMKWIANNDTKVAKAVLHLVPEYTRWDNILCLLDTPVKDDVIKLIQDRLNNDIALMKNGEPISLLAKWLPSNNASSNETRRYARKISSSLGYTDRQYRKTLSSLRKYLNVIERFMSSGNWDKINYESVPSRANLIYKNAFIKHDEKRRAEYLTSLEKGESKINSSVLFPHDIVHNYDVNYDVYEEDTTLEELWKALPNYVEGNSSTLCVADGSGSMTIGAGNRYGANCVSCLDIANALAIYFSERCSGPYKDKYITFSENPKYVDLSECNSLYHKIRLARKHNECSNTNIEAVFDLVLDTALANNLTQDELPANILILSDMEFDDCATTNNSPCRWYNDRPTTKLFDEIAKKYAAHGYKLPKLVFWNICSRTNAIPVQENDLGVGLVSGFSPAVCKMVLSESTDPYQILLETINAPRYDMVEEALRS